MSVSPPAPVAAEALPAPSASTATAALVRFGTATPTRYRLFSLVTVAVLAATALTGFVAADQLTDSSDRARRNTGPVLVATQDVFASIAEADAASAAVFLSGTDEDREQRRLYEVALQRSTAQLEEVSRLVGDDDEAHDRIKAISAELTSYAGLVERARLANTSSLPGAEETLGAAIAVVQEGIVPEVETITDRAQAQLDADADGGRTALAIAVAVAVVAGAVLVIGQVHLSRRTRRLLNLPLVAATLCVVVMVAWLLSAWIRQQSDLDTAREAGYDSIALTADIQTTGFRYKTLESLSLISDAGGEADAVGEQEALANRLAAVDIDDAAVGAARSGEAEGAGLLLAANRSADSTREQAATAEMMVRWQRYLATSLDIRMALDAGERDGAVELAIGDGNADFNGFNTSVESVLSDNRTQFTDGLADARGHLDNLRVAMVGLPVVAALLMLWGYQLRIREYR